MLGPSGEFVELRVSGVRRLQRDPLPSRRRPAARSAFERTFVAARLQATRRGAAPLYCRRPPDARTSHRHELPFNIMWARLKQVGWTWKQGSGLHPYSYFRPGANTSLRKGALEGRDYFSTEAAVVQFVKSRPVWKSKFYGAFKGPAG